VSESLLGDIQRGSLRIRTTVTRGSSSTLEQEVVVVVVAVVAGKQNLFGSLSLGRGGK
jgi:hypothetical protein